MGVGVPVEKVLRFKDKGVSVEEARRNMLAAGEAPKGLLQEVRKNKDAGGNTPYTPEPVAEEIPEPAAVAPAAPVAAVEPPVPAAPIVERRENAKFILEIRQDGGEWVGEITYKNGAGSERFVAPSRNELNMKLLEGKAHGTLRVRESIRREKYGVELDKAYELPDNITQKDFDAMPQGGKELVLDALATNAGNIFKDLHPEYYPTSTNSDKIQKFLRNQQNGLAKGLPITLKNLEYAFAELSETDEEFEFRPEPKFESVAPSVPAIAPLAEDSAPAALATAPVSTVAAPATPAIALRKRGTTGLRPGDSSAANTELEQPKESQQPSEPSVAELRKSSPAGQPISPALKQAFRESLASSRTAKRQF